MFVKHSREIPSILNLIVGKLLLNLEMKRIPPASRDTLTTIATKKQAAEQFVCRDINNENVKICAIHALLDCWEE